MRWNHGQYRITDSLSSAGVVRTNFALQANVSKQPRYHRIRRERLLQIVQAVTFSSSEGATTFTLRTLACASTECQRPAAEV